MQKDERIKCIHLSSIKAASHWFIQATCLDDYQLSPKRFMIVTVTSVESSALHLADFKWIMTLISPYNPRPSQVKWGGLNMCLMEFQQQSDSRRVFGMSCTTGTQEKQMNHFWINIQCVGGILLMYSQQWDFKAGLWPSPCDSPTFHLSDSLFIFYLMKHKVKGFWSQQKTPGDWLLQHWWIYSE